MEGRKVTRALDRLIAHSIIDEYYTLSESERKLFNEQYWGGAIGTEWNRLQRTATSSETSEAKEEFVARIVDLTNSLSSVEYLVEIGTGNGELLVRLSERLKNDVRNFVGLDLSAKTIAENIYLNSKSHPHIQFLRKDLFEFLSLVKHKSVIFVAVGTFEYFTEDEVRGFLVQLNGITNVGIAIKDTINFDRKSNTASKPRGSTAFSHNYELLLKESQFKMLSAEYTNLQSDAPFYEDVEITAMKCQESCLS